MYRQLFENSKEAVFIVTPGRTPRSTSIRPDVETVRVCLQGGNAPAATSSRTATPIPRRGRSSCGNFAEIGLREGFPDGPEAEGRKAADRCSQRSPSCGTKTAKIVAHQGILHDITERLRAEEALAESEERLKLTLDAAHIVAWEINADGSHREAGPVHELFGRPEGFHHPELSDLLRKRPPRRPEGARIADGAALRGEREYQIEFRVPQEDGSVRWVEAVGTLQRDAEGRPVAHPRHRRATSRSGSWRRKGCANRRTGSRASSTRSRWGCISTAWRTTAG